MPDIRALVDRIEATVASHRLEGPGLYARWLWQDAEGNRELGLNDYGCADAANILYTIGRFPGAAEEREAWIGTMQRRQDPVTGLFHEKTHHPFHTTAHCLAALELFDARPLHPLRDMARFDAREKLAAFLDGLDWKERPWPQSHQGAGLYAARVIAGEATAEWIGWYFDWLWENSDGETGLWRKGYAGSPGKEGLFPHMAGSFHYLFNHEHARRPLRYPCRMIDSCLRIYRENDFAPLGKTVNFAEIDWVYCLARALRQSGHRFAEVQEALREFGTGYIAFLENLDPVRHDGWNDLHALFGATCALAELQQALPGFVITERPLKLVLDRRPFI